MKYRKIILMAGIATALLLISLASMAQTYFSLDVKGKGMVKPVVVGHNMGGFISFRAAASAPGLFEKVITVRI